MQSYSLHSHTLVYDIQVCQMSCSGVERCFVARGLTIGGVSIYSNVGGLRASFPRNINFFAAL